jgi:hypothetical protein
MRFGLLVTSSDLLPFHLHGYFRLVGVCPKALLQIVIHRSQQGSSGSMFVYSLLVNGSFALQRSKL